MRRNPYAPGTDSWHREKRRIAEARLDLIERIANVLLRIAGILACVAVIGWVFTGGTT